MKGLKRGSEWRWELHMKEGGMRELIPILSLRKAESPPMSSTSLPGSYIHTSRSREGSVNGHT